MRLSFYAIAATEWTLAFSLIAVRERLIGVSVSCMLSLRLSCWVGELGRGTHRSGSEMSK